MSPPLPHPIDDRDPAPGVPPKDRRRWRRLPVTLSARVHHGRRSYRAQILDVSAGGLLLAPVPGLPAVEGGALRITAALIGQVPARVVAVSQAGVHVAVEASEPYAEAVGRLADLMRAWDPLQGAVRGGAD